MESAHKVAKTKRYKDTFKASFKDFNIPTEFWEQATQVALTHYQLRAAQFDSKRICEAARMCKERKARAKGSSSDSAQSEFTICNR